MTLIAQNDIVRIERLVLGPYGTNAYVVICQKKGERVVVDAPDQASEIIEQLRGLKPHSILMTHNHMDHVGALAELASLLHVPVAAHPLDADMLPITPDVLLHDGDTVSFGSLQLRVLHTPGHTPGSLCFLIGSFLIAGDTIFPGGPGKTSSSSRFQQIVQSIEDKIMVLPDDTQIFPGHGDATLLEKEKQAFGFFSSRSHDPKLCGDVLWVSS